MPNISGVSPVASGQNVSSTEESGLAEAVSPVVAVPQSPFLDDRFLHESGTFALDHQIKLNQQAHQISDAIWSVIAPLTQKRGTLEEQLAAFLLLTSNSSDCEKKRKIEEIRLIEQQEANLKRKREENLKHVSSQKNVNEENGEKEAKRLKMMIQNANDNLAQIYQRSAQEAQTIGALNNAVHEAIMNTVRQMHE